MAQRTVCNFCYDNILRARISWDYHHPSYLSLGASARRQCVFCTMLYEDVKSQHSSLGKICESGKENYQKLNRWMTEDVQGQERLPRGKGFTTSLYRWSIRSLGRTRESKQMIAVTFRVIPEITQGESAVLSGSDAQKLGLPERVFFCFPESDLGPLLIPAHLGTSTNPNSNDGYQIQRWIRTCGIEHKSCPKRAGAGSKWVPTRLLYVGGKRRKQPIRVVETAPNNVKGPYVTLSHCWGPSKDPRADTLRKDTFAQFTSVGVPWHFLSKNFQQAIEVTRFLEVDYIWIDSLCIIQQDGDEWKKEGALMHKVYRNSYCNIAAADAEDSQGGLFRERDPYNVLPARIDADENLPMPDSGTWRVAREDLWDHGLLKRPLYTRGWVFQERMLAPRILHFSQHQLFWDCAEMSACESFPAGIPLPLDQVSSTDRHWKGRLQEAGTNNAILLKGSNDDSPEAFWEAAVEAYTSLSLTNQGDKQMAIWGIAKMVRDSLKEEYAVGLWEHALEEQLAWTVADCTLTERPASLADNPSWSWTSIIGTISAQSRSLQDLRAYRIKDHAGNAISFKHINAKVRPKLRRAQPKSYSEVATNMSKDLVLSHKERAASRQNSLQGTPTPKHDSTDSIGYHESSEGLLFGGITMSPQPIDADQKHVQQSKLSRQEPYTPRRNTDRAISQPSRPSTHHVGFELAEQQIEMHGYLLQGILEWVDGVGGWTIDLESMIGSQHGIIKIDAFPDIKPAVENGSTLILILALSQHIHRYGNVTTFPKETPNPDSWYTGHGIMLRPTGIKHTYSRFGAFRVRHLGYQAWQHIKALGRDGVHERADNKCVREIDLFVV